MVGEAVHDAVPQRFVGVHQRLGVPIRATGGALDQIAANGERGTCERQQRHLVGQLGDQQVDRVGDIGDVVGIEWAQPIEIGGATNRLLGDRAGAGLDVDPETDGVRRHDDVAVQHGGIDAVPVHRLQCDLGGELWLLDRVEDRSLAPDRPVLGQAATRLAHEPDRGMTRRATGSSVEQRDLGRGGGVGIHAGGGR